MNRIKRKLNNQSGASLSWALLIFLVCTVVGSAVLVAGTAAGGRISKLAENDQRYYSVTSTAGLLRDVLNQGVTVTRLSGINPTDGTPLYTISYDSSADAVVKALVRTLTQWPDPNPGHDYSTGDAAEFWEKDYFILDPSSMPRLSISFSASGSPEVNNALATVNSFSIDSDGDYLYATLEKDSFIMQLSFKLVLERVTSPENDKKTYTFKWVLEEVQKVESTPTPPS